MLVLARMAGERILIGDEPIDVVRVWREGCMLRWRGELCRVPLNGTIDSGRIRLCQVRKAGIDTAEARIGLEYPADVIIFREEIVAKEG